MPVGLESNLDLDFFDAEQAFVRYKLDMYVYMRILHGFEIFLRKIPSSTSRWMDSRRLCVQSMIFQGQLYDECVSKALIRAVLFKASICIHSQTELIS